MNYLREGHIIHLMSVFVSSAIIAGKDILDVSKEHLKFSCF